MKRLFVQILFVAVAAVAMAQVSVSGSSKKVIDVAPESSTGLNKLFVVYSTDGISLDYQASSAAVNVTFERYSNLGGGFAEAVDPSKISRDGNLWKVQPVEGDMGYIILEDGIIACYCWVVDYSLHPLSLDGLTIGPEQSCDEAQLLVSGGGDYIYYYGINGRRVTLSRDVTVEYNTLVFNEDAFAYSETKATKTLEYLPEVIRIDPAPLCDTRFYVVADRFLQAWGMELAAYSTGYTAHAISAETRATQTPHEDCDNEQSSGGDSSVLGGSAPAEITFEAAVTDAVVFKEWQFSYSPDFIDITNRVNSTETTYTFVEQGVSYVRFKAANAAGDCDFYGPTYEISIGASDLKCPNAFSPGASEGVNDEWKVSYKSIVTFECHIFNRWGTKMATLTHPSQGWDGRYGGKLVPAGVYYYVIKAEGADGVKYNLSGDINIVNYR